jgi:drug/metabolite transporter superfamily protein YnfA
MNISVRYMRDFKRTYRCTLYLRRKVTMVFAAVGVLMLLVAFLPSRSSQAATVVLAVIGVIFLIEVPFLTWLTVIRNWNALNEEVEVTVTSEEIVQRTATTSLRLSWDMMQRIISRKDMWLFYASRLKLVTLYKGALTAAEQAELAAFIEARKRLAGISAPVLSALGGCGGGDVLEHAAEHDAVSLASWPGRCVPMPRAPIPGGSGRSAGHIRRRGG